MNALTSLLCTSWLAFAAPVGEEGPGAEPAMAEPEAPEASEPVPMVGSVAIHVVGTFDSLEFQAAVEERLAPYGLAVSVTPAVEFVPQPAAAVDDRVAEIWLVASSSTLKVVVADPGHEHIVVHELPRAERPAAELLEDAALVIEGEVAMAMAGVWPEPEPPPTVVVEAFAPQRPPEPPPLEPEDSPPAARGRFHRGLVLGGSGGLMAVRYRRGGPHLGLTGMLRFGYVFGRFAQHPDLRVSTEARVGNTRTVGGSGSRRYKFFQVMLESRVGITRGPVWIFAIGGLGSGVRANNQAASSREGAGLLGTLGAGAAVRLSHYLALHFDAVASGNPGDTGRLGLDAGLTFYIDPSPRRRAR